jgi:Ser/Thr protein kinase RdoA (MazF antagonist)
VELARVIEERYDLGPVEIGEPLQGGYANDVLRLDAGGAPYVLRIEYPPVVHESIAWEHRFLEQLQLDVVPVPIRARDGSSFFLHDRSAVWLLPFIAGRLADGVAVARTLGRIHAAASELRLPQRPTMRPLAEIEWRSVCSRS